MGNDLNPAALDLEAEVIREERTRIARVIHDVVAQDLALLMLKLEIVARLADKDPARMKAELAMAVKILERSIEELREVVHPAPVPDTGRE